MPFTKDGISPNIIVNPNALKNMKQKGAFVNLLLVRNIYIMSKITKLRGSPQNIITTILINNKIAVGLTAYLW